MTFLSPSILWALIAVSIPLIIHLISLRQTKYEEFSSLKFIKLLEHNTIKQLKINQWLLVLLRSIAIFCLILIFSRPLIKGNSTNNFIGDIESRSVIFIDNSASMNVKINDIRLLDKVKLSISELLKVLEGDNTIEIYQTNPPQKIYEGSFLNESQIISKVEDIVQTNLTDNIWEVTDSIINQINPKEPNLECYIFSDFQTNPKVKIDTLLNNNWTYYCIDQPKIDNNISIKSVDILSEIKLPNHLIKLSTSLDNNGIDVIKNVPIELFLNQERVGQVVSQFEPNKYKDFMFQVFPGKTGIINGKIVIPDDDYSLDNYRNFDLVIPDQIALKIIGKSEEDLMLLDLALNAIKGNTELLQIEKRISSKLERVFLNNIDILLINDSPELTSSAIEDIQRFLIKGGALIWFAGNELDKSELLIWPSLLKLPELIRKVSLDGESFFSTTIVEEKSPLFADLDQLKIEDELPQVYSYNEVRLQSNHLPLMKLNNGHPLLIQSSSFGSKGFTFTSKLNLRWNDFTIKGLLIPLLHRMLILLATKEFNTQSILVGDRKIIDIKGQDINNDWTLITPSNNEIKLIPDYTNEKLQITQTNELGSYNIFINGEYFSSFSTILSPNELPSQDNYLKSISNNLSTDNFKIINPNKNLSNVLKELRYGKSIWRLLLIIALFCLVLESLLGIPNKDSLKTNLE
ncbi:MAG: BatA domain-containing protein [Candidatus Neomarinimicrobiota bacterium]|nr:BatA domain-containing protein [Candidatus Neomarinimicrobiota bacterium]